MYRAWPATLKILTGIVLTAASAMPQAYTISAKPGGVNYIEGEVSVNGKALSSGSLKTTFLSANDTLSTEKGKAEVLLAPGIFLRVGDNSQVRMISPSLADTQIELKAGEAMIEVDNIVKDSRVTVQVANASTVIDRNGLYKFTAGDMPSTAVLEGKAKVLEGERRLDVGKGKQLMLAQATKAQKFDTKKQDDLYAWSNVRAAYNAASSYQTARDLNAGNYGGVWGGYGYSGFNSPGWFWNSAFNSWAWLPGNSIYYSPFGFGFYGPGLVGYAPVIYAPVYGGSVVRNNGQNATGGSGSTKAVTKSIAVPVNPVRPPAIGAAAAISPAANQAARNMAVRSYSSNGGFRTATGAVVPAGRAASLAAPSASRGGGYSSRAGMPAWQGTSGVPMSSPAPAMRGGAAPSGPAHR